MSNIFTVLFSFFIALLLQIVPLPSWATWFRPEWVLLVLIFWILVAPYNTGLITAFFLGLIVDLLTNTLLGEHAAAFVVVAYFVSRFHTRISLAPWWQQSLIIAIWVALYQVYLIWISRLLGGWTENMWFWLPAITSGLFWPWVYSVLKGHGKKYRVLR